MNAAIPKWKHLYRPINRERNRHEKNGKININWIEIIANHIQSSTYAAFECFHVIIHHLAPSLFQSHALHVVNDSCAHHPTLRTLETLTLTLRIHCCNKRIEIFAILGFHFQWDARSRVTPRRTAPCSSSSKKETACAHEVIGKAHKKSARRFVFSFHTCNSCTSFFVSVLLFVSCNAPVRKQHLKLGGGERPPWFHPVDVAERERHMEMSAAIIRSKRTHHWKTLKWTFDNTARALRFFFIFQC